MDRVEATQKLRAQGHLIGGWRREGVARWSTRCLLCGCRIHIGDDLAYGLNHGICVPLGEQLAAWRLWSALKDGMDVVACYRFDTDEMNWWAVVFSDQSYVTMPDNPGYAQSTCKWGYRFHESAIGVKISFDELPENVRNHLLRRLEG
jgi:hypothetical protein